MGFARKFRLASVLGAGLLSAVAAVSVVSAGPYPPAAGRPEATAIHMDDPSFVNWATAIEVIRGPMDIANPDDGDASFGTPELALGAATGAPFDVISLGDGGTATLTFATPIANGPGFDFAVFENGFESTQTPGLYFLELAFVEVSSNGQDFFRFDAISLTPLDRQIGSFVPLDPTDLYNFAGKYEIGYGTPFDLEELAGRPGLDIDHITYVRIIDAVGSIKDSYATYDSLGNPVNDPWPTPFNLSGFDLEAVGVIHMSGCVGDFDFDSDVDGQDLAQLVLDWETLKVSEFGMNFGHNNCKD